MTPNEYNIKWHVIIEDFMRKLASDPWIEGRIATAAKEVLREITLLRKCADDD